METKKQTRRRAPSYFEMMDSASLTLTPYLSPSTTTKLIHRAKQSTDICNLGFFNVRLTGMVTTELEPLVQSRQWRKIIISWCRGEDVEAVSAAAIVNSQSLEFVAHCQVNCPSTALFLRALESHLHKAKILKRLKLQCCHLQSTAPGGDTTSQRSPFHLSLGKNLARNTSLKVLELSHCRCDDEVTFSDLMSGLTHHTQLESLVIRDCTFAGTTFSKLCQAISRNRFIRSLSLDLNEADISTVDEIAELIANSDTLAHLSIRILPVDLKLSPIVRALRHRKVSMKSLTIYSMTEYRFQNDLKEELMYGNLRYAGARIYLHGACPLHPWRHEDSVQDLLHVVQANPYLEQAAICIDPRDDKLVLLRSKLDFYALWNRTGVRQILEQQSGPPPAGLWPMILEHVHRRVSRTARNSIMESSNKATAEDGEQDGLSIVFFLLQQQPEFLILAPPVHH